MYRLSSAFFKHATAFAALSISVAASAGTTPAPSPLPMVELVFHPSRAPGKPSRVGDAVLYELKGGTPDWHIDPKEGALTKGFLFRSGKLFIPLVPGKVTLPSLSVLNGTQEQVAKTDPIEFSAESNLPPAKPGEQPPKSEPAIGPMGLPFPLWIQETVIGLAALGVLVLALFVFRFLKRRAKRAIQSLLPKKPYDSVALERLDTLLRGDLKDPRVLKKTYFAISEILKNYLGERYSMDAEESTTSELIAGLNERNGISGLNDRLIERVGELFGRLDPVKFADLVPTVSESEEAIKEAKDLIEKTRKEAKP
ncbi:MAG: hypothetical protein H7301_07210 [Cryobacterium sp.]|nr:hypothetical protein [Oligoflexia bacterium]